MSEANDEGRAATALILRSARALPAFLVRSTLARAVGQTLAVRVISVAVGVVVTIVVARALGPSGRGLYAVAGALGATGTAFANFGLQTSNTYYVSRDRSLLAALLANSVIVSLVIAPLVAAIAGVLFFAFPGAAPIHGSLLVLALLAVPLGLAYLFFQNLLLGVQDFRSFNLIELVSRLAGLGLLLGLVATGERQLAVLFAAGLVPAVIGAAWSFVRARGSATRPPRPSRALLRRTLAYGLRAYLGAFFAFMLLRSDLLIVKYKLGAERAGYYSIAVSMADLLYIVPTIIGMVIFPRLAAAEARDRRVLALRATVAVTVLMALSAAVSAGLARPGIDLAFGRAFAPAATAFMVLAAAMIFYGANNVVSNYAAASGYPWFAVWIWLVALVLNVGLNLLLIPPLGIVGSAIASLVGYALVALAQTAYFFRAGSPVARQA